MNGRFLIMEVAQYLLWAVQINVIKEEGGMKVNFTLKNKNKLDDMGKNIALCWMGYLLKCGKLKIDYNLSLEKSRVRVGTTVAPF